MFLFNGIDTIFQPIKEMCEILSNHGINSQTQLPAWMVYSYQAQQLSSDGRFDNLDGLFDISSPENPTACRLFFSIVWVCLQKMRGSCLVPSQLFHTKRVVSKILKAQVNSELPCTVCCPWVRWECRCWVCWVEMMAKNGVHVIEIPCNFWISLGHVAPFLTSFLYWSYSGDWTCKYCCSLSLTSTFILVCTLQKAVGDLEVLLRTHKDSAWKTILHAISLRSSKFRGFFLVRLPQWPFPQLWFLLIHWSEAMI